MSKHEIITVDIRAKMSIEAHLAPYAQGLLEYAMPILFETIIKQAKEIYHDEMSGLVNGSGGKPIGLLTVLNGGKRP